MLITNFRSILALSVAASVALCISAGVRAGEEDFTVTFGKAEFGKHCAVCHGLNGMGDGALADLLTLPPPDLTKISQRNNGKFPILDIYQAIDGRRGLRAHGTMEMPLWGNYYKRDASETLHGPHEVNYEEIVHGRILALVYYLQSIQVE